MVVYLGFCFLDGWFDDYDIFWGQTMIKIQELKLPHNTFMPLLTQDIFSLFWTKHNVLKAEQANV